MKQFLFFACLCGILIGMSSCKKKSKPHSGIVTFYGTVLDSNTGAPISGVQITISGSDATPSSSVTGSDGSYELPITVVPTEKDKTMRFVLVAKKNGAVSYEAHHFLQEISDFKYLNWDYTDLYSYFIAYGTGFNIGWEIVGEKVSQSFNIKLEAN